MKKTIIAWDLGATKCAAGIVEYRPYTQALRCEKTTHVKLTATTSLLDLIEQLEKGLGIRMNEADAICIGAAGHFDGEHLLLEGKYPYPMPFAQTAKQLNWPIYTVIHDYAPIVCATFTAYMEQASNVKRLNDCPIQPEGRRVAFGIGTGLGGKDGVQLENGDFWLGNNELGHVGISIPPRADSFYLDRHHELMKFLQQETLLRHPQPVTFEKILSGQGTVRLYQFFYPDQSDDITPEMVGEKMRQGETPEMLAAFAWYTGMFVGLLQLSFMPQGGIWVTGGVALSHLEMFDHPDFYAGIYAAPAYRQQRDTYPLGVLCNQEHALIGSGYYAAKRLLG